VVATRNRERYLPGCLESIERQAYPNRELIVVDDASTDGTREVVSSVSPSAILLSSPKQLGIGGAYELGLARAGGEIVVILDDDAYLTDTGSTHLIARRFTEVDDLGILCFHVEAPDGTTRAKENVRRDKQVPQREEEIAYFLSGACAIRLSALRRIGGFPLDFEVAATELDVSFRLLESGYRILFAPYIRVVHLDVATEEKETRREFYLVRNNIWLAARYLPFPFAQVRTLLWLGWGMISGLRSGNLAQALRGGADGLARWAELRGEGWTVSSATIARMNALSGRTWY